MRVTRSIALWLALLTVGASLARAETVALTGDLQATGFADSRKVVHDPANGNLYVAYRSKYQQDGTTNYRIFVGYSTDNGATWALCNGGNPIDTEGSYMQRVPSLAISPDSAGTLHLAWYGLNAGKDANQREIKYSHSVDHCASWSATLRITDDSGFDPTTYTYWQEHPVVLTYGNFVFIAWEGRDGTTTNGGVRFIRSADKGQTFDSSLFIQRDVSRTFSRPALAATGPSDAPTLWVVSYAGAPGTDPIRHLFWTKSTDAGVSWQSAWARVCSTCTDDERHASLSRDPNGKIYAAWRGIATSGYSQIYYAQFGSSGFNPPVPVSPSAIYQFSPQVEVDQANNNRVYVVWSESVNASGLPEESPADGNVYYATKAATDAGFGAKVQLTSNGYGIYPTLRRTTKALEGQLDVVWTDAQPVTSGFATVYGVDHLQIPRD